jgi:voltage-gated potassium channel
MSTKLQIAQLLDERNISKSTHVKLFHIFIRTLIVLSCVQFIIEDYTALNGLNVVFKTLEIITVLIFSIEYALRFWTCDLIDEKYAGARGKVRYVFSFYSIIDLLSILPFFGTFFLNKNYTPLLRNLRVLRAFRLARYMKSFDFIVRATKKKKSELSISLQLVIILTFVLSVFLFQVEHRIQPDKFSTILDSLLWSFSKFIGDIGGYGDFTPKTGMGMILATCVGILSIAIFAVPAGIIASGFVEEIEEEKHTKEIDEKTALIESSFTSKKIAALGINVPKRKRTLPELQARLNYTDNEIFESVRNSNKLRIKWDKSDPANKIADLIVLEYFDANTSYGVFRRNTQSKIHLINPIGRGERGISHFCNTIAEYGQFNIISNELFGGGEIIKARKFKFDINPLYSAPEIDEGPQGFLDFCSDIKKTISKDDWTFIFRSAATHREFDIHVLFGGEKGNKFVSDVATPTLSDTQSIQSFVDDLENAMKDFDLKVCTHDEFSNSSPNLLHQFVYKETKSNVVTIFLSIDVICSPDHEYYKIIKSISDCIGKTKL